MRRTTEHRVAALAAIFVWLTGALTAVVPRPAEARVDPLVIIKRQIHKPNILVVLDTSGSLTGVPGGTFTNSSEVGVDCNEGENCRGGASIGTCASGGKSCSTDDHCRTSTCKSGIDACTSAADCPPVAGTCSTGESCFASLDCPSLPTGRCATSGSFCNDSNKPCSSTKRCSVTATTCSSAADCRTGVCTGSTTGCSADSDCPYATSGGTCAWGATPTGGCSSDGQCQVRPKVCSDDSTKSCASVNDCGGRCVKAGTDCRSNADCTTRNNDSCSFGVKTCGSPANSCLFPRKTCNQTNAGNACVEKNACVFDANSCIGTSANQCLGGVPGDVCNASSTTTGSRMCRAGLSKCTRDLDCTKAGDTCGPATSRFVIAKRVLRGVATSSANVVNLGLMTYFQDGYFPYYVVSGGGTTTTGTATITHGQLMSNKCYSKKTGLKQQCTVNGKTYTLRATNNTKYLVKGKPDEDGKYVDATYCGYFCSIPGQGTGIIKGAYYDYQQVVGTGTTLVTMPTYMGKTFTKDGVSYRYYDARPDYYNGGAAPPIDVVSCGLSCGSKCGGRWDEQLAPFLSTDEDPAKIDAVVDAFARAMEPASEGGLIAYGGTPTGCTLDNAGAQTRNTSAYSYMEAVKTADPLSCRQNYVLLVTDGEANGPGDSNCGATACSAADPAAAGCTCRAVLAAYKLRKNLGVKTLVVGFATDATTGAGRLANDNIAKAGGTDRGNDGASPYAFGATSEAELTDAIQAAIYEAVKGSYSTAPATASQGAQKGNAVYSGTYLIDSRVDFPTWKGHLIAYDVSEDTPRLAWDATAKLEARDWKSRRVYTSNRANNLVRIQVDPQTGAITNRATLRELGLGATEEETDRIARWMLGDPAMKNPALMGSIVNSTPLDVAAPPESPLPGGAAFAKRLQDRPGITYVGSDNGMLHAIFTKPATVAGVRYDEGSEAFAYAPPSMLPVISGLYAQGGQLPDPKQHIFGLASSPKAKNLCVANCNSPDRAVWKTYLVMTEGWGGNGVFVLDVTDPIPSTGAGDPFGVVWTSKTVQDAATFDSRLGQTVSIPSFMFVQSDTMDDHRLLFASGYAVDPEKGTQGKNLLMASALTGRVIGSVGVPQSSSCAQEHTLLTDVASSRLHVKNPEGAFDGRRRFLSAYVGDTWGNLWRFSTPERMELMASLGCQQPIHFSPTIVQMDQDDPNNPPAGETYVVQVTNSTLDETTRGYEPSKIVIFREQLVDGRMVRDPTWGREGRLELASGNSAEMCAITDAAGERCLTPLPAGARPLASPLAIPKQDGSGFLLLSTWYAPAVNGCGKGSSYLMQHEISESAVRLRQALALAEEPVTNALVISGKMMFTNAAGPVNIGAGMLPNIAPTIVPSGATGELFMQTGWKELE